MNKNLKKRWRIMEKSYKNYIRIIKKRLKKIYKKKFRNNQILSNLLPIKFILHDINKIKSKRIKYSEKNFYFLDLMDILQRSIKGNKFLNFFKKKFYKNFFHKFWKNNFYFLILKIIDLIFQKNNTNKKRKLLTLYEMNNILRIDFGNLLFFLKLIIIPFYTLSVLFIKPQVILMAGGIFRVNFQKFLFFYSYRYFNFKKYRMFYKFLWKINSDNGQEAFCFGRLENLKIHLLLKNSLLKQGDFYSIIIFKTKLKKFNNIIRKLDLFVDIIYENLILDRQKNFPFNFSEKHKKFNKENFIKNNFTCSTSMYFLDRFFISEKFSKITGRRIIKFFNILILLNAQNVIGIKKFLNYIFFHNYLTKLDIRIYVSNFINIFSGLLQSEINTIFYRFSLAFFKIYSILNIFIKFIWGNFFLMFKIVSLKLSYQSILKKKSKTLQNHQNKSWKKILKKQLDILQLKFQLPRYFLKKKCNEIKVGIIRLKFRQILSHSQVLLMNLLYMRSGLNILQFRDYVLKKPNNYMGLKKHKICRFLSTLKFKLLIKIKNFKKNNLEGNFFYKIDKKKATNVYQSRNIYIFIKNFICQFLPFKNNKISNWKNFFFYKKIMKTHIKRIIEKNLKKSRISIFVNFYFFFIKKNIEIDKKVLKKTGFCFFCFVFFSNYYFNSKELTKKKKKYHSYLVTILYKNKEKKNYFKRANELFSKLMFENLKFTIWPGYLLKTLYKKRQNLNADEKCFYHNFIFYKGFSFSSFFVSLSTRLDFFFYFQKIKNQKKFGKFKKNLFYDKKYSNSIGLFFYFFLNKDPFVELYLHGVKRIYSEKIFSSKHQKKKFFFNRNIRFKDKYKFFISKIFRINLESFRCKKKSIPPKTGFWFFYLKFFLKNQNIYSSFIGKNINEKIFLIKKSIFLHNPGQDCLILNCCKKMLFLNKILFSDKIFVLKIFETLCKKKLFHYLLYNIADNTRGNIKKNPKNFSFLSVKKKYHYSISKNLFKFVKSKILLREVETKKLYSSRKYLSCYEIFENSLFGDIFILFYFLFLKFTFIKRKIKKSDQCIKIYFKKHYFFIDKISNKPRHLYFFKKIKDFFKKFLYYSVYFSKNKFYSYIGRNVDSKLSGILKNFNFEPNFFNFSRKWNSVNAINQECLKNILNFTYYPKSKKWKLFRNFLFFKLKKERFYKSQKFLISIIQRFLFAKSKLVHIVYLIELQKKYYFCLGNKYSNIFFRKKKKNLLKLSIKFLIKLLNLFQKFNEYSYLNKFINQINRYWNYNFEKLKIGQNHNNGKKSIFMKNILYNKNYYRTKKKEPIEPERKKINTKYNLNSLFLKKYNIFENFFFSNKIKSSNCLKIFKDTFLINFLIFYDISLKKENLSIISLPQKLKLKRQIRNIGRLFFFNPKKFILQIFYRILFNSTFSLYYFIQRNCTKTKNQEILVLNFYDILKKITEKSFFYLFLEKNFSFGIKIVLNILKLLNTIKKKENRLILLFSNKIGKRNIFDKINNRFFILKFFSFVFFLNEEKPKILSEIFSLLNNIKLDSYIIFHEIKWVRPIRQFFDLISNFIFKKNYYNILDNLEKFFILLRYSVNLLKSKKNSSIKYGYKIITKIFLLKLTFFVDQNFFLKVIFDSVYEPNFLFRFQANKLILLYSAKKTIFHTTLDLIFKFLSKYKNIKCRFSRINSLLLLSRILVILKNQKTSFLGICNVKHRYWFFLKQRDDLTLFFSLLTFKIYLIRINSRNLKKLFAEISYISKTINTFNAFFLNIFFIKSLFIFSKTDHKQKLKFVKFIKTTYLYSTKFLNFFNSSNLLFFTEMFCRFFSQNKGFFFIRSFTKLFGLIYKSLINNKNLFIDFLFNKIFFNWEGKNSYLDLINGFSRWSNLAKKNNKPSIKYKFFFYEKNLYYRYLNLFSDNLIYPSLFSLQKKNITVELDRKNFINYFRFYIDSNGFSNEKFSSYYYFLKEFLKNGNFLIKSLKKKKPFNPIQSNPKHLKKKYFPKKKIYLELLKNSLKFLNLRF